MRKISARDRRESLSGLHWLHTVSSIREDLSDIRDHNTLAVQLGSWWLFRVERRHHCRGVAGTLINIKIWDFCKQQSVTCTIRRWRILTLRESSRAVVTHSHTASTVRYHSKHSHITYDRYPLFLSMLSRCREPLEDSVLAWNGKWHKCNNTFWRGTMSSYRRVAWTLTGCLYLYWGIVMISISAKSLTFFRQLM